MSPAIACPELDLYLKHYNEAVLGYCNAVVGLRGELSPSQFEVAYKRVEETRLMFEQTREQLNTHIGAHGCQPNGTEPIPNEVQLDLPHG
jgi:hypothetical protein